MFISSMHPLTGRKEVTLEDLEDYPFLAFEQGTFNSFYFSEEILSTAPHKKTIHVSDRATLFNLLIGFKRLHDLQRNIKQQPKRRQHRVGTA